MRGGIICPAGNQNRRAFTLRNGIYYAGGNKCGKLLARATRTQSLHSHIQGIRTSMNKVDISPPDIAACFQRYYKTLYNLDLPQPRDAVAREERLALIRAFLHKSQMPTLEEQMASDGLPAQYYKTFRETLNPHFFSAYNGIDNRTVLPPPTLEAHITVIPKEGKDPQLCSSYRPISLLNVDLKLFTRILLNGLLPSMPSLIDLHQCYRKYDIGRQIRFTSLHAITGLVVIGYGKSWREQRRFTLTTLRNFGMGKKSVEERVAEEAQCLCTAFKSYKGHPFDPHYLIDNAVSNMICSITFGDRFEYDDAKFQKLLHLLDAALQNDSGFLAQVLNEVPWLLNIPWLADHVLQPDRESMAFLKEIISEHKKSWNPHYIRDFIDAYLLEMEKVEKGGESESSFTERNLLYSTYDLFTAGTGTTSTTLRWALLYMLLYPDIQEKIHEEIDEMIGRERKPAMADILEMPYTNAVIHEIQRCSDIAPLALPHMTYRDMEIRGCFIPKGTTIFTNISSVLKDEQVWEKPYQFYPKHFLDENGKFAKQEAFIPFSAGRRACLGEQLARMELFLFFTTLLQQFTFEIPNNQPRPRDDPTYAFLHYPHPYKICAVSRV
ncbi:PREDICTED: cytochrome P450 2D17-like [Nanorana parkeri]|uniref:cytochrome P450 2D17-like n=1 Tax=Nanorana parkeri TaxID=125878 RepID=UPI0008548ECB|nr:PREDICTED: cytochrome P450 2D17-like [Nanorana parkeri]